MKCSPNTLNVKMNLHACTWSMTWSTFLQFCFINVFCVYRKWKKKYYFSRVLLVATCRQYHLHSNRQAGKVRWWYKGGEWKWNLSLFFTLYYYSLTIPCSTSPLLIINNNNNNKTSKKKKYTFFMRIISRFFFIFHFRWIRFQFKQNFVRFQYCMVEPLRCCWRNSHYIFRIFKKL